MSDTVQGYRVSVAKEHGVVVAIMYDKVMFWGNKGGRDDGWAYKTHQEMSDETGLSIKRIRLAYAKLVEMGVIETKVMKVGSIPTCHFRLVQKGISIESDKRAFLYKQNTTTEDSTLDSKSSFGAAPPSLNGSRAAAKPTSRFHDTKEVLQFLIDIINPREKVTDERLRMLNARRKDYKPEEIIAAAHAFSKSDWHKENKQMSVDNLLAPSKFGRWYARGQELSANDIPLNRETIDEKLERERRELEEKNKNRDWGFGDASK